MRLPMQADIGFGDAVSPAPAEVDYPRCSTCRRPPAHLSAGDGRCGEGPGYAGARHAQPSDEGLLRPLGDLPDVPVGWAGARWRAASNVYAPHNLAAGRNTDCPDTSLRQRCAKQAQWRAFIRRTAIALAPQVTACSITSSTLPSSVNRNTRGRELAKRWTWAIPTKARLRSAPYKMGARW